MRNANECGFGATGDPNHPYYCEYGPDTYYPTPPTFDELRELYHQAGPAFQVLHRYFAAKAMMGDLNAMEVWDKINKILHDNGFVGFSCGRSVPWGQSVFNNNRKAS